MVGCYTSLFALDALRLYSFPQLVTIQSQNYYIAPNVYNFKQTKIENESEIFLCSTESKSAIQEFPFDNGTKKIEFFVFYTKKLF